MDNPKKLFMYAPLRSSNESAQPPPAEPDVCIEYRGPGEARGGCGRASIMPQIAADASAQGYKVVLDRMPDGKESPLDQFTRDRITVMISTYPAGLQGVS